MGQVGRHPAKAIPKKESMHAQGIPMGKAPACLPKLQCRQGCDGFWSILVARHGFSHRISFSEVLFCRIYLWILFMFRWINLFRRSKIPKALNTFGYRSLNDVKFTVGYFLVENPHHGSECVNFRYLNSGPHLISNHANKLFSIHLKRFSGWRIAIKIQSTDQKWQLCRRLKNFLQGGSVPNCMQNSIHRAILPVFFLGTSRRFAKSLIHCWVSLLCCSKDTFVLLC